MFSGNVALPPHPCDKRGVLKICHWVFEIQDAIIAVNYALAEMKIKIQGGSQCHGVFCPPFCVHHSVS